MGVRCKHCKTLRQKEEMITINMSRFCDRQCAIDYALDKKVQQRANAKIKKAERKEHNKKKFEVRSITKDHDLTQRAFNKMRVLEEKLWFAERGREPECISCGKKNMDWCCGHHKTVKAQGNLRYDRKNTALQCNKYCNKSLSGNIEGNKHTRGYKKGLIERYGEKEGLEIIEYCETHTEVKKWTKEELKELRKDFSAKARELQLILTKMGVN